MTALILMMQGCQKKEAPLSEEELLEDYIEFNEAHNARISLDYQGVYEGVLPCDECEGLEVKLVLEDDENYSYRYRYIGSKQVTLKEERGKYQWNDQGNTIELSNSEPKKWFVAENSLIAREHNGNATLVSMKDSYTIRKINEQPVETTMNESASAVTPLMETKWQITHILGVDVSEIGDDFELVFSKDGRIAAFAGCNRIMGDYEIDDQNRISFEKVASTRKFCEVMNAERLLIESLEKVDNYMLKGKDLQLNKARMAPLVTLKAR